MIMLIAVSLERTQRLCGNCTGQTVCLQVRALASCSLLMYELCRLFMLYLISVDDLVLSLKRIVRFLSSLSQKLEQQSVKSFFSRIVSFDLTL